MKKRTMLTAEQRSRIGEPVPELPGLPAGSPHVQVVMNRREVAALQALQRRGVNREAVRIMARMKREARQLERARLEQPLKAWVEECWAQRRAEQRKREEARP